MANKKNLNINNESSYPDHLAAIVDRNLLFYVNACKNLPAILKKSILYSIKNGGKRFRPVLCLLTVSSLGKNYGDALPAACAIEFIHTYSLIHDDLPSIDNDDFRRGKLTCHKVFGEDIAILTGDALFAEAFNIIIKYQAASPDIKIRLLEEIAVASGAEGMVAGQVIDVFYTGKKISKKMLDLMHDKKTAKLITASVRCGAIIAGADENIMEKLTVYANCIGLAFQITDDILDIEAGSEVTGKTAGKDAVQNKNTFPSMYGIKKSREIAEQKIKEACHAISGIDIKKENLVNLAEFILKRKK
ncbi:MAG: polyprenyl synthetase family protein [Actinobacteria bacterium]|nr:polyprenyl synthetase family protein [Actinomycetota bacterium]